MAQRTAGEAGWHKSRYNLSAPLPGTDRIAMANLLRGTYASLSPLEQYLLSVVEELSETHPIIERFARKGLIANFDERAAIETIGRASCMGGDAVSLTICPTMACNFDCPYCFERHDGSGMAPDVQDDVIALAVRMMETFLPKALRITWYGGEPLLETGIIAALSDRLGAEARIRGTAYQAEVITNGYLLSDKVAVLLARAGVQRAQVTLDGLGDAHNATRHLAGGGPSFATTLRGRLSLPAALWSGKALRRVS